ncbi:sulfatase-like hydrolase/transferase [Edaphobacter flagellatus]|uniref:sulfatase-like hydrolase/transferase n=1 Tax=Edaphobacter flagellatus TaxID=1933044 RepID=UPI0021B31324|nr:sulfatase-like hydrolase/transferase [Edaphobacter flagellatus]
MDDTSKQDSTHSIDRRSFIASSLAAGVALRSGKAEAQAARPSSRPNIIIYLADQFRADFVGANGQNPSTRTPNLDAMAARGTNFTGAICNQPVCSPSRSILMTGRYATETGVWHNARPIDPSLPTLAGELRKAGYSANLIGKWHLAPSTEAEGGGRGYVKPEQRGGFLDMWEGANEFEWTTHPYEGTIYDADGKEITFKDEYRVDFVTDRAERFLRQKHDKPFLLYVSQLEPHFQNVEHGTGHFVGPKGSAERFANPFVPNDLKSLPGNWQQELPDYYGCCEAIDKSVGHLMKVLEEEKLANNTIVLFTSDHGCHFMTRNEEYKRSPHNASIRIPLIVQGPGFNNAMRLDEVIGNINVMPTLLEAAGLPVPSSVKGKSFMPLMTKPEARSAWPNRELVQISESMTARALRTKDWTYCVLDVEGRREQEFAQKYVEYQMYSQAADPFEQVNLAGRKEFRAQAAELREELKQMMQAAGEPPAEIVPVTHYP